jgi:hypothetical protein
MRSASAACGRSPLDMARRSYLRRIAEPLKPGLPALFSVPSAASDERRPPAASASAGTPTLRRATALRPAASSPGRAPRASFGGDPRAAPNTPPSPTGGASLFALQGSAPDGPAIATGIAPQSPIAPDLSPPSTDPAVSARFAPPPLALGDGLRTAPTDPVSDTVSMQPAASEDAAPAGSAALDWAEIPSPEILSADPIPTAEATAPADPRAVVSSLERLSAPPVLEQASPRIHIGTVEVRTTPQPPPPAAVEPPSPALPPAASPTSGNATAQLSRAYGWRYGLIQS